MKLDKNKANLIYDWYSNIKNLDLRLEKDEGITPGRSQYQRDYARILYSSSFRRLQGKNQFLGISSDKFFRNRLTHSLEVSQIATSIAQSLSYTLNLLIGKRIYDMNDIFVLQASSLAHDLGHPAFGHAGEETLNHICSTLEMKEGYEGNAQTLRILMDLEKKSPHYRGLNLTLRTLLSVVKYYRPFTYEHPKSLYRSNYDKLNNFIEKENIQNYIRTLDVQIVDLADEIAYSVHDLEDCLNLGIFTIDELLYEFKIWSTSPEQIRAYEQLKEIVELCKSQGEKAISYGNLEEYKTIVNKCLVSKIIDFLIDDISIVTISKEKQKLFGTYSQLQLGFKEYGSLASGLKELVFKSLKRDRRVKEYTAEGVAIIDKLFNFYKKNPELMSIEYWERYNNLSSDKRDQKNRVIIDYLSGMMDLYAINKFESYFGEIKLGTL